MKLKVEILYFDGCPSYGTAEKILKGVLADEGIEADVVPVAVNTDEESRRLRFPGSPTFQVDERDLFPAPEREDWRLGCRVYATPEGLKGSLLRRRCSGRRWEQGVMPMPTAIFRDGLHRLLEDGAQLVDVLLREEYEDEHLPGAISIPLKELNRETSAQLRHDVPVIVYCHNYQKSGA